MGADLIVMTVIFENCKSDTIAIEHRKETLLNAVDTVTDEEVKQYINYYEDIIGDVSFESDDIEGVKDYIRHTINDFFDRLDARDVTWLSHKGDLIYITGGMSWGDSPTDSYFNFEEMYALPESVKKAGGIL